MNTFKDNKISIAEHNRIIEEVKEAHADYQEAKALAAEAEACEVMPNCPDCKGEGQVEIGAGDPAFNPNQTMLHGKCPNCKGKGYVEK